MSNNNNGITQKQKGLIGLAAMAVLAVVTIWGSTPIYKAIDGIGKKAVSYTDGTFTGEANGFGGAVTAEITVSGGKIESVVLAGDSETPGIGTNALEQLPDAIISSQSAEVDAVAGATITSNAVKEAVIQALGNAQ